MAVAIAAVAGVRAAAAAVLAPAAAAEAAAAAGDGVRMRRRRPTGGHGWAAAATRCPHQVEAPAWAVLHAGSLAVHHRLRRRTAGVHLASQVIAPACALGLSLVLSPCCIQSRLS
jgi:hypothetical protein